MPRPLWLAATVAAIFIGVAGVLALRAGSDGRAELRVAAASDLRDAFEEIGALFEAECECRVRLSFGSSGMLASQIREGLPVDVFASANAEFVDRLQDDGLIAESTRQLYGIGRIVLATPPTSTLELTGLQALIEPGVQRVTIANPAHAPYGLAARQALESSGLWQTMEPRLVLGENASIATEYVQSGNVDAGIVPLSLVIQRPGSVRYNLIDDALHEPLEQVIAVIRRSRKPEFAAAFIGFVNGPTGREVMRRYGFVLPEESGQ